MKISALTGTDGESAEPVRIAAVKSESLVYAGGMLYFSDKNDGGKLYRFDPVSKADNRLTSLPAADFAFYNGYLYDSTVKYYIDFDFYRMDMQTGEASLLSQDKCLNDVFVGEYIYYENFSSNNTLNRMRLDGSEDTVVFDAESVDNTRTQLYKGKLYFTAGGDVLHAYDTVSGKTEIISKEVEPTEFIIAEGKMLLKNCNGANHVALYDLATGKLIKVEKLSPTVVADKVSDDARNFFFYNGNFYYYRNIAAGSKNCGLYRVSLTGKQEKVGAFEGIYICEGSLSGDTLYFLDVWKIQGAIPTTASTATVGALNLKTGKIEKLQ